MIPWWTLIIVFLAICGVETLVFYILFINTFRDYCASYDKAITAVLQRLMFVIDEAEKCNKKCNEWTCVEDRNEF